MSRICLVSLLCGAAILAGCTSMPSRPPLPEDSFCRSTMRPSRPVCIEGGVPSAAAAAQVGGLPGIPGKLTVYIVRNNQSDITQLVSLKVADSAVARTLPRTFVRLQLAPGQHSLRIDWRNGASSATVQGNAGEVRYLQLKGWPYWSSLTFSLEPIDSAIAVELSQKAKLVADVVVAKSLP